MFLFLQISVIYFPLIILKGIYHYWKYVFFLPGAFSKWRICFPPVVITLPAVVLYPSLQERQEAKPKDEARICDVCLGFLFVSVYFLRSHTHASV